MSIDSVQMDATDSREPFSGLYTKKWSRRQVLRTVVAGSVMSVGGTILTACGGTDSPGSVNVTLQAAGWPIRAMPTAEQRKTDPGQEAYAQVLQQWLNKNPGVKVQNVTTSIWDPTALTTAVASGTAPSWYPGSVLGTYQDEATRSAFVRGLAADTTGQQQKYDLKNYLTEPAHDAWKTLWKVDGKYYGAPGDFYLGRGIFYRRDWFKKAGIKEPEAGWTWEDFRKIAQDISRATGKKGAAFQGNFLSQIFTASQFELLTRIPDYKAQAWHWQYDYTTQLADWERDIKAFRGMVQDDKTVLFDTKYGDEDVRVAFVREDVAMFEQLSISYTGSSDKDIGALLKKLNKSLGETVGYVVHPNGTNKAYGNTQTIMGIVSFNPRLRTASLDKAYDLYLWYYLGDGVIEQNKLIYKKTPTTDTAKGIYGQPLPANKKQLQIDGIPGNFETYYGKQVYDAMLTGTKIPLIPITASYIQTEQNSGPTSSTYSDAISTLSLSQSDSKETLTTLETTRNTQAKSIPSNVSPENFQRGAQAYYKAVSEYWQKNSPEFYSNTFEPFYKAKIAPALQ